MGMDVDDHYGLRVTGCGLRVGGWGVKSPNEQLVNRNGLIGFLALEILPFLPFPIGRRNPSSS